MLSEMEQVKDCYNKKTRPVLADPLPVRILFRKVGNLQYISHLDLQRTIHRIFVRSGIPVWYTQGFNPHIKIVFSPPLSIGMESECEMIDIRVDREISCEEMKELLNREVTDEMRILDVYVPKTKFSDYIWSEYEMEIGTPDVGPETAEAMNQLLSENELMVVKKTKSGEKELNLIPQVKSFHAVYQKEKKAVCIDAVLNVSSENYLNPGLLLDVLFRKCKISREHEDEIWYTIRRIEALRQDGITPFR